MKKFSRLASKEEKRNTRRAVTFGLLSLGLILALIFLGPLVVVKMAVIYDSLRSPSSTETQESLPPAPPIVIVPYEATNSATLNISGFAQAGGELEIFLNNASVKKFLIVNDGSFTVDNLLLNEGQNAIYATVTDQGSSKSATSERTTILYDPVPPLLEITQPKDKTVYETDTAEISGKTEPEVSLLVNDHLVVIDKEGRFTYRLGLSFGDNGVIVRAIDKAGNQTEQKLSLNYSP